MSIVVQGKVLVTGATGTQGSAVAAAAQAAGLDVVALVRHGGAERVQALIDDDIAIAEGDLNEIESAADEVDARLGERSWSATHRWLGPVGYPARPEHARAYGLGTTTFAQWAQQHRAELTAATTPAD